MARVSAQNSALISDAIRTAVPAPVRVPNQSRRWIDRCADGNETSRWGGGRNRASAPALQATARPAVIASVLVPTRSHHRRWLSHLEYPGAAQGCGFGHNLVTNASTSPGMRGYERVS